MAHAYVLKCLHNKRGEGEGGWGEGGGLSERLSLQGKHGTACLSLGSGCLQCEVTAFRLRSSERTTFRESLHDGDMGAIFVFFNLD